MYVSGGASAPTDGWGGYPPGGTETDALALTEALSAISDEAAQEAINQMVRSGILSLGYGILGS